MSESYGIIQSLVCTPVSRVTQQPRISQFNTRGCGRCGRRRSRVHGGIVYFSVHVCRRGHGHGRGGQGGNCGRIYGQTHMNLLAGTENSWQKLVYTL